MCERRALKDTPHVCTGLILRTQHVLSLHLDFQLCHLEPKNAIRKTLRGPNSSTPWRQLFVLTVTHGQIGHFLSLAEFTFLCCASIRGTNDSFSCFFFLLPSFNTSMLPGILPYPRYCSIFRKIDK